MKKIGLVLIYLLAGVGLCQAGVVTPERSAGVAADFFMSGPIATKGTGASSVRLVASFPVSDDVAPGEAPALYVYAREAGGFVLVAGDDVARPVLGYAEKGSFPVGEEMPVNLKSLLKLYAQEIGYARAHGWEADASVRQMWTSPASAVPTSPPVLLTTATWNQMSPFNDMCPKVDGQECPCGCVATAIGIIMRYHKWPAQGTGVLPAYDFGWDGTKYGYHVDAVQLGHTYEWDKMPMDYSSTSSQESRFQVARLMRDIGVMSEMDYYPTGSGAGSDSPIPLATYFGYDRQMRYYDRADFSDAWWESLIRKEIDAGRPVFHCGCTNDSGHAFVMDGYNDRYFHINYGWGGSGNAYYTMTPISGHESDLTDFNKWQDMVCHIQPDQGGAPYVNLYISSALAPFGWDFQSDSFRTGETWLHSYGRSTDDGQTKLCYCLYDRDGNLKETLCDPFTVTSGQWPLSVPSVTCKAPSNAADGDCIMLSREGELAPWEPLPQTRQQYLKLDGTRSLSELVSVGHTFGWVTQWGGEEDPNLFIRAYKDIYWELRTRDGLVMMTSARSDRSGYCSLGDWNLYFAYQFDRYDTDRDWPYFEFFLPSGEYTLFFRNFSEEMTLSISL